MFWDLVRKKKSDEDATLEDDIRQLADQGSEDGSIEENENEWIQNVFEFNDLTAAEIMTREPDIVAIPLTAGKDEIIKTIHDSGLSRYPVYGEDLNDILGILNARDFLLELTKTKVRPIKALLRKAYFVPESVRADRLFSDMQKSKQHLALVVDEYGDTTGLITMEDLLEEIVGNIYDEFDPAEQADVVEIGKHRWRVSGNTTIRDLSDEIGVDIEENEDYDTLSGLIMDSLNEIPEEGSKPELDACGLHIQVTKVEHHHIEEAIVSIPGPETAEEE